MPKSNPHLSLVSRFVFDTARFISASLRVLAEAETNSHRVSVATDQFFTAQETAWFRGSR